MNSCKPSITSCPSTRYRQIYNQWVPSTQWGSARVLCSNSPPEIYDIFVTKKVSHFRLTDWMNGCPFVVYWLECIPLISRIYPILSKRFGEWNPSGNSWIFSGYSRVDCPNDGKGYHWITSNSQQVTSSLPKIYIFHFSHKDELVPT